MENNGRKQGDFDDFFAGGGTSGVVLLFFGLPVTFSGAVPDQYRLSAPGDWSYISSLEPGIK